MTTRICRSLVSLLVISAVACSDDITPPTAPSDPPTTFTFATSLRSNGAAARSFVTENAGVIVVTLNSVTPDEPVGFGIGIPRADGASCNLTHSIETGGDAARQLTATADAGAYCIKVFDMGGVREEVWFSSTVMHP